MFVLCSFCGNNRKAGKTRGGAGRCETKQSRTACKPGSVPRRSSARSEGRVMAIHLGRPSPDASRDLPGQRRGNPPAGVSPRVAPIWSCSRWGLPCHRRYRQRGALLPHPFTLARLRPGGLRRAVCFLWHFPWGCPRRVLPGTVFPWSPDFPPPAGLPRLRKAAIRPSGRFICGERWCGRQAASTATAAIRAAVSPSMTPSNPAGR